MCCQHSPEYDASCDARVQVGNVDFERVAMRCDHGALKRIQSDTRDGVWDLEVTGLHYNASSELRSP